MLDKEWFINKINSFLREDESNKMTGVDGILIWEPDVIVGFCSGDDPIFEYYKEVVGPFHLTPAEALPIYSCGLCQVNVSCSDGISSKK